MLEHHIRVGVYLPSVKELCYRTKTGLRRICCPPVGAGVACGSVYLATHTIGSRR